jgi:predicted nucleic acid-binding protein
MLVDTDVLIWHLRGYPQATRRLDELGALMLSAVSYLELLQGMRNKAELLAVKKMLDKRSATLLPLTKSITRRATELMESRTLSHGLQMGDALIAATAVEHQLSLLTANVKHFSAVQDLTVEAFLPGA